MELGSYALVDVETTGLRPGQHRVLSVAALLLDDAGAVVREFHTLVDPGGDPGPVHIHGLTREILRGAPEFGRVAGELAGVLSGRVLVAHNARFDHGFLAAEFRRAGVRMPVRSRMCTLALARRIALPTVDFKLATLAAHYGVVQRRAHDALDDTRVLAGVLRGLAGDAARLGISAPVLDCADEPARWPRSRAGAKPLCEYRYPGRLPAGEPLVQGMKVAITGDTALEREVLVARAEAAGLDVTGAVSGRTSVLVCNDPGSGSAKARRARELGTVVLREGEFLRLLGDVRAGEALGALPAGASEDQDAGAGGPIDGGRLGQAVGAVGVQEKPSGGPHDDRGARDTVRGPLTGRRVIVLGGTHTEAARIRAAVTNLGGAAAANLSARVTDVVALPGGRPDQRLARARRLGLPIHGPELVQHSTPTPAASTTTLARGQVTDLPDQPRWTIRASWHTHTVDLVAFLLDDTESVARDADFVFYNQPETRGATLTCDGPAEQAVELDLTALRPGRTRIVIAAALEQPGITFGDVGPVELDIDGFAQATLDAATEERTLLLAEVYRRGERWRLRAVGQGYPTGLAELAAGYGVELG
ncbi:exonuclease domain-containing protein [Nocardia asteroides]|uniref:TerD family protein n=1 Tax=Nocardia asteroides TaxID=1824 RepID=UPI001E59B6A4|nr:exonuclease domain-containing protein [Nocardia asteroides]UGT61422.1 TerD family protein [Nocardia asteroides]